MPYRAPALAPLLLLAASSAVAAAEGWTSVNAGRSVEVVGSGRIVSQARPIGPFRAVEVRGAADVQVRVGLRPTLTITADDNVLPLLRSEVRRGDVLVLEAVRSYRTRRTPQITITVPQLTAFALKGSGDATISGVNSDSLALALSGSGDIRAQGRAGTLSVAISGSGDIDASGVASRNAAVVISGSGDATVRSSGTLTGVSSGSGDVRYIGRPSTVAVRVASSGSVGPAR